MHIHIPHCDEWQKRHRNQTKLLICALCDACQCAVCEWAFTTKDAKNYQQVICHAKVILTSQGLKDHQPYQCHLPATH